MSCTSVSDQRPGRALAKRPRPGDRAALDFRRPGARASGGPSFRRNPRLTWIAATFLFLVIVAGLAMRQFDASPGFRPHGQVLAYAAGAVAFRIRGHERGAGSTCRPTGQP